MPVLAALIVTAVLVGGVVATTQVYKLVIAGTRATVRDIRMSNLAHAYLVSQHADGGNQR